jgi:hypothetical protein
VLKETDDVGAADFMLLSDETLMDISWQCFVKGDSTQYHISVSELCKQLEEMEITMYSSSMFSKPLTATLLIPRSTQFLRRLKRKDILRTTVLRVAGQHLPSELTDMILESFSQWIRCYPKAATSIAHAGVSNKVCSANLQSRVPAARSGFLITTSQSMGKSSFYGRLQIFDT